MARHNPRLFLESSLFEGKNIDLMEPDFHYLHRVMRLDEGETLRVFNKNEGEWQARFFLKTKKSGRIAVETLLKSPVKESRVLLAFSPLRPHRQSFLIEKATELGVTDLYPLWMDHTAFRTFSHEKTEAHIKEAAEQSERLSLPFLHAPQSLGDFLMKFKDHSLFVGDERGQKESLFRIVQKESFDAYALLIGPEGGFSVEEFSLLEKLPSVRFVTLGPTILRAETAALAALSLIYGRISE